MNQKMREEMGHVCECEHLQVDHDDGKNEDGSTACSLCSCVEYKEKDTLKLAGGLPAPPSRDVE